MISNEFCAEKVRYIKKSSISFLEWKERILSGDIVKITKKLNFSFSGDHTLIDGTDVTVYHHQGDTFIAGLWLQNAEHKVYIYSCSTLDRDNREELSIVDFPETIISGPVHQHAVIEVGYVVQGCSKQCFSGKVYEFHKGDFWITDPNCFHSDILSTDDLLTVYFGIPKDIFDAAFLASVNETNIQHFIYTSILNQKKQRRFLHFIPKNVSAEENMQMIFTEIVKKQAGFRDVIKGYLIRLLFVLSTQYTLSLTTQDKQQFHQFLFHSMEEYIREHYRTVTISELMEHFNYNEEFYNRIIKEYSGFTYSEYLRIFRMQMAEHLLKTSSMSVDEIADSVGYRSKGAFYKAFVSQYHCTPAIYRKQSQVNHCEEHNLRV
jgi:AraC-like DNA-binding protein